MQIYIGYGFVKEYHLERWIWDAKVSRIYEGTFEFQKIMTSHEVING